MTVPHNYGTEYMCCSDLLSWDAESAIEQQNTINYLRQDSHYTILSLRHPVVAPHDTDIVTTSCSVRPSLIPSVMILKIGGNRRPYSKVSERLRIIPRKHNHTKLIM